MSISIEVHPHEAKVLAKDFADFSLVQISDGKSKVNIYLPLGAATAVVDAINAALGEGKA